MGMSAPKAITTLDELLALPEDGLRHELLDGVHVVTPSPRRIHQRILSELIGELRHNLSHQDRVEVLSSPADIFLGERTLVQPDLFLMERDSTEWRDAATPCLTIEILSPATASRDRGVKRRLYFEAGVEEYWIVDGDARLVERWRSGDERPEIIQEHLEWSLKAGPTGTIDLAALFRRVF